MKAAQRPLTDWLPITPNEVEKRGWDALDVVLISGDAYVDHPSFGAAILGRWLEKHGFRVAILSQPDWRSAAAYLNEHAAPADIILIGPLWDEGRFINYYYRCFKLFVNFCLPRFR